MQTQLLHIPKWLLRLAVAVCAAGLAATFRWWSRADHTR